MPASESFLKALKNPVVTWKNPFDDEVKVINPDICMSRFQVEFDNVGTRSLRAYIYTPRLQLYSVGSDDDATNLRDLTFAQEIFGSKEVMEKLCTGETRTPEQVTKRFGEFTDEWKVKKSPISSFMCYSGDEPVGLFVLEEEGNGSAELSSLSAVQHWKKGYATEVGMLLYKYPRIVRDSGYKMADGSVLQTVTATARPDNGSAIAMERLGLTCVGTEVKYGAERKVYRNTIEELDEVVSDTNFRAKLALD